VSKLFLIRLAYSKTFSHTGQEKEAVRALPQSLSYLVLAYLTYIQPFEEFLLIKLNQKLPEAHFLLFYDHRACKPLSSRVLSRTLKNMTSESLAQLISLSPWRHLMQGFIRHGVTAPTPQGRNDGQKYGAVMTNCSPTTQSLCGRIRICSAAACFGCIVT
jgi:hypothetical protein